MKIYYVTGNKRKIDRARVIAEKVSGENGWGMDKIFIPKGMSKTKAELDGVVIGLSGGIDSTTAAALCKEALLGTKYFVRGLIMGRAPEGQKRRYSPAFVVGRGYKIKVKPDVKFDRDRYFNNLSE